MLKADAHQALGDLQARLEGTEESSENAFLAVNPAEHLENGQTAGIAEIPKIVNQSTNGASENRVVSTPWESPSPEEPQPETAVASSRPRVKASRKKAA